VDELTAAAAKGVLTVDLNEAGRGFFGLIDADGDSRISIRELRAMPKLVERFDTNKDGSLAASEVPRRFEAPLSPGIGLSRVFAQSINRFGQPAAPPKPQVGPLWFQKMDRNHDGDVSRREFLGTEEQFNKLDADRDGLISAQEAEAAEKK
jgi:Ca2+-binding EF-hand superfamily protein